MWPDKYMQSGGHFAQLLSIVFAYSWLHTSAIVLMDLKDGIASITKTTVTQIHARTEPV